MSRDFKYKVPGIVFYLFSLVFLLVSQEGIDIISNTFNNAGQTNAISSSLLPLVTLGIALVTSDGVGFIFVTVCYAIFNLQGGYSKWFKNNLKLLQFPNFLKKYSYESNLIYFHWYAKNNHIDDKLDLWLIRRYSVYFTNYSSVIALISTLLLCGSFFVNNKLTTTPFIWIWLGISIILIVALIINSEKAKKESIEILQLFEGTIKDDEIRNFYFETRKFDLNAKQEINSTDKIIDVDSNVQDKKPL